MSFFPKEVWRINPDGELRDTYKKLKNVFSMSEESFFDEYLKMSNKSNNEYYESFNNEDKRLREKVENLELPFSNLWIAKNTINKYFRYNSLLLN